MKSIRTKITMLLTVCVLVASLVVGIIGTYAVSDTLRINAEEKMKLICDVNVKEINTLFETVMVSTDVLSTAFSEALRNVSDFTNPIRRNEFISYVKKEASGVLRNTENISGIYFYLNSDLTGEQMGFFLNKDVASGENHDFGLDGLYIDGNGSDSVKTFIDTARHAEGGQWSSGAFNPKLGTHVNYYTVPVYSEDTYAGILGMYVSVDDIDKIISKIKLYESGFVAVLDENGKVLCHPEHARGEILDSVVSGTTLVSDIIVNNKKSDKLISYTSHGQKRMMVFESLINGMRLCVVAPEKEIFSKQNSLIYKSFLIILVISFIAVALAYIFAHKFTKPILKLNAAASEMTRGNLEDEISVDTDDEVGQLARNLNEARSLLKEHISLLYAEAHKDGLTGINNKIAFEKKEEKINEIINTKNFRLTVAIFDVNNLKVTNDILGHLAGDELLIAVVDHICKYVDKSNVYRIGGDEFAVILTGSDAVNKVHDVKNAAVTIGSASLKSYPDIKISCAYGIAEYDAASDKEFSHVLVKADRQMYLKKAKMRTEQSEEQARKGIKQLQIEKYLEFLRLLSQSTEDYLFLYDIESDINWMFGTYMDRLFDGDAHASIGTLAELQSIIYIKDQETFKSKMELVFAGKCSELDMNLRLVTKSASLVWLNLRGKVIDDEVGHPFIAIGRLSANELKNLYNPLTGMFNKIKFSKDVRDVLLPPYSHLMLINIDGLSALRLKNGRKYADDCLCILGRELDNVFEHNRIYHMEEDDFVILVESASQEDIKKCFDEINEDLKGNFTVSVSVVPNDKSIYVDAHDCYEYARQLLAENRSRGQETLSFFSNDDYAKSIYSVELLEEFEKSVRNGCHGFYLCYQPKVSAIDYSVFGAEALLRYKKDDGSFVYPNDFIPILERSGLIKDVGLWVLDEAASQCAKWREKIPGFRISVNFSCIQFRQEGITGKVLDVLKKHNLPGSAITLEITESVQYEDTDVFAAIFKEFREHDITISIDDFGTGYANMSYLKKLHTDEIKIDRVFIQDIKDATYNYRLVKNIIEFAKVNSFVVCLEGVEKAEELAVIESLGADALQGYLFDKPLSVEEFEAGYMNISDPAYHSRMKKIQDLNNYKDKMKSIYVDSRQILYQMDTGLWVMRTDKVLNTGELFFDTTMCRQMGIGDGVSSVECFNFWYGRIREDYKTKIQDLFVKMMTEERTMTMEYFWNHPTKGEVCGKFTGKCMECNGNEVTFEGFHRIISDVIEL